VSDLAATIAALTAMSPAQLRAEWRRVCRATPPEVSSDVLRRGIAYRLQERAYGGLPAATGRKLDRIAAKLAKSAATVTSEVRLKPGTRLVRRWQGTTYTVTVDDKGYVFEDRRFTSLSQIAETITEAHWSGPRFFGTGRQAAEKRNASNNCDAVRRRPPAEAAQVVETANA
jgi:hypothetical protein